MKWPTSEQSRIPRLYEIAGKEKGQGGPHRARHKGESTSLCVDEQSVWGGNAPLTVQAWVDSL